MQNTLSNDTPLKDNRNYSFDIIRVLAIAAVVMIHVSSPFVTNGNIGTVDFFWGNLFDAVSRIGVPLFLMLSGALLLNEDKPFSAKKHILNRTLPLAVTLIFWSFLYALAYNILLPLLLGNSIDLKAFVQAFIDGHYHLWFMYMLIGIYLALPLLRKLVNKNNSRLVLYYIIISLLANFLLPLINILSLKVGFLANTSDFIDKFELGFFSTFITYYLAGWYIANVKISSKKIRIALYSAAVVSIVAIILYCSFTRDYGNAYTNQSILIFLFSIGAFLAISNGFKSVGEKAKKVLQFLSKMSFGIYIVHVFVLYFITKIFGAIGFDKAYSLIYIIVSFLVTFAMSVAVTFVISKIPLLKKTLKF